MITASAPLRVSFNGGGSDLPSFFSKSQGNCITLTLNKNVYVSLNPSFGNNYRIAYSQIEITDQISEIKHQIVRNTLNLLEISTPLEIASIADVPSQGSGLGSSSAFTIALLKALSIFIGKEFSEKNLAEFACEIELNLCKSPIGLQDQYAIAYGGLNHLTFDASKGASQNRFLDLTETLRLIDFLNSQCIFFHIDRPRSTPAILNNQNQKIQNELSSFKKTELLSQLGLETKNAFLAYDIKKFGQLIFEGWKLKSELNGDIYDEEICRIIDIIESSKVYGAKLLGAGKGGFLMVISNPEMQDTIMKDLYMYKKVDFKFSNNFAKSWLIG